MCLVTIHPITVHIDFICVSVSLIWYWFSLSGYLSDTYDKCNTNIPERRLFLWHTRMMSSARVPVFYQNLKESCWNKAAHFFDLPDFLSWKATGSLTRWALLLWYFVLVWACERIGLPSVAGLIRTLPFMKDTLGFMWPHAVQYG